MGKSIDCLKNMEYPGRVIIIGRSPGGDDMVMYAITGRSPSSQARKLELSSSQKEILVKPTDDEELKKGDPDLLIYPAIMMEKGVAVSNGKHTKDINLFFRNKRNPIDVMVNALSNWEYEPDDPNFTPRIGGCLLNGAALSIIKRAEDGKALRYYFEIPLIPGKGKVIATYTGFNESPLASFKGEPADADLPYANPEEAAEALYESLAPAGGGNDFRVAAAAVFRNSDDKISISIKNRHG